MEDKERRMKQSEAMKRKVLIQEEITALSNKKIKLESLSQRMLEEADKLAKKEDESNLCFLTKSSALRAKVKERVKEIQVENEKLMAMKS